MQLESQEIIQAVIGSVNARTRQPRPSRTHYRTRERCTCGRCPTCTDNEKWERIFAQKFADPTYYLPRLPRSGSSLRVL